MKISVLASGSRGNSTYIESKESKILVDAGISIKRLKSCLNYIDVDLSDIDAVFVTHEHNDHIRSVQKLNNYEIPIYLNRATYEYGNLHIKPNFFTNKFAFKDLTITPIPVSHDAADPCGFKIQNNGLNIGIFTDLGKTTNLVKTTVRESDFLILESNHDIDMLINGPYPYQLKQRILSDKGHLSNIDAALLVKENTTKLKTIFLAHISQNNNTKDIVYETFSKLTDTHIKKVLTDPLKPTDLFNLDS